MAGRRQQHLSSVEPHERLPDDIDEQESGMKRIAVRALKLRTFLLRKMSRIKSVRLPALSIWLGVYGGELPPSLAPVPIRRRRT